jgi:hypothetical protein
MAVDPKSIALRMPTEVPFEGNGSWHVTDENNDPHSEEYYPDGFYEPDYVRRGVPSEMNLDRMISPPRMDRENGYLPGAVPLDLPWDLPHHERRRLEIQAQTKELNEKEAAHRKQSRASGHITIGNATGRFTGPPDRSR